MSLFHSWDCHLDMDRRICVSFIPFKNIFSHLFILGVTKSFHTEVICNNLYGDLTCAAGVIQVTFANYGRIDDHTCPFWKQTETNCHASDSLTVVSGICQDQTQCSLTASLLSFTADNCNTGIHRYLTVSYICDIRKYFTSFNDYVTIG